MSCNGYKTSNTCGQKIFSTCVYYEGILPLVTTLGSEDCYTVEEIIVDTYQILSNISEEVEVDTLLGDLCLSYTMVEGRVTLKQAMLKFEEEICDLKNKFDNIAKYQLCDIPISGCNLDLKSLADQCSNPPTTFGELIQVLIDAVDTLQNP